MVTGLEVVDGPSPSAFDGVIVNVYDVKGIKPVKVMEAIVDVCVGVDDGGFDVTE